MSYRDNIEAKISGDSEKQNRRKDILNEIVSAFEQGSIDAVRSELTKKIEDIETQFQNTLSQLRNSL